eukprot:5204245-Pleurochrysis_carterae.AAC.1
MSAALFFALRPGLAVRLADGHTGAHRHTRMGMAGSNGQKKAEAGNDREQRTGCRSLAAAAEDGSECAERLGCGLQDSRDWE